jgi:hypothetical protein
MKKILFIPILIIGSALSGCATQKYTVETVGYSSWKGEKMLVRRKAILLNTQTGETWGLTYNKANPTTDGYGWEKIPGKVTETPTQD